MFRQSSVRFLLVFVSLLGSAWAQRDLATLTGTLTDTSGAVVAGAKVTIAEVATGLTYNVTTDASGIYVRPALKPGIYTIEVEAPGFRKAVQRDVLLTAGDRIGANITLQVGEATESVDVHAQAPLLQTENTTIGMDLNSRSVAELPLGAQRRVAFLARLSVGVVNSEPGVGDALGGGFSAAGVQSSGQNNFLLNGVDNNVNNIDFQGNAGYVITVPPEAVGEMRILTNGYNAEYGRGAGGMVDVTLKSGTNELHGVAYEFLQNEKLDANRWDANKAGTPRGALKQNQFGVVAGGPIIKNRSFWFADYSGLRFRSFGQAVPGLFGAPTVYTIPTPAMVHGDFSGELGAVIGTDALGNPVRQGVIYDFLSTTPDGHGGYTRVPFENNTIPLSRMDPVAKLILSQLPAPNQNLGTRVPGNNFSAAVANGQQNDSGDLRIDHRLTAKDSLFGSLSWANGSEDDPPALSQAVSGSLSPGFVQTRLSRLGMLSYTRIWTPAIISETRMSYNRLIQDRENSNVGIDTNKVYGIPGLNPFFTAAGGGLPSYGAQGYSALGGPTFTRSLEYSNVWDYIQNVAISKGKHALKFGAEHRVVKLPFLQPNQLHGTMTFNQDRTNNPDPRFQGATGDGMASFLLGYPTNFAFQTSNWTAEEHTAWAFFGQDDWKVTPKLTLNLGLRYELFSPWADGLNHQANLALGPNGQWTYNIAPSKEQNLPFSGGVAAYFQAANVTVTRGQVGKYLIPWDKHDFGPRLGFAYQMRPKLVIRGAYGIYYGGEANRGGFTPLDENPPFNQQVINNGPTYTKNPYIGRVSDGYPLNLLDLAIPGSSNIHGEAEDLLTPMVQKWNLAIQQELPFNTALEVSYLGNHLSHLIVIWDPNAAPNRPDVPVSSARLDDLRPNPALGGLVNSYINSFGFGNYDALGVKLEKRFSKGLEYTVAYTWGHALANSGATIIGTGGASVLATPDPRNISLEYSSALWDIRHTFIASSIYELPIGKGKAIGSNWNPFLMGILGNWQMNGILTLHTGSAFGISTRFGVGYIGYSRASFPSEPFIRPSVLPGKDPNAAPPGGRTPDQWFDTSNIVAPAPYTQGNLGNNTNVGPGARNLDFSLFKEFPFRERYKVTFRGEIFNVFNTPQFADQSIDVTQGSGTFGRITATNPGSERRVQFGLRFVF